MHTRSSPGMSGYPAALTCAMVAGEASGDLLAALLLRSLRSRWPDIASMGIGGPGMQAYGFEAWWPHELLAVHGYSWELIRRYRQILSVRRQLCARLLAAPPSVFVGVDAPDFNLDLELWLKRANIPTVHFVCPAIWAWRADRVHKLRLSTDHVLCIFPFEPELLAKHGIAATYVGHPLAGVIPMQPDRRAARANLGLGDDERVLAVLPGSRAAEIRHIAPVFFDTISTICQRDRTLRVVIPAVPSLRPVIEALAKSKGTPGPQVRILDGQSHTALAACDVALVASGTATLEAALFKRPMVIAYRMGAVSWEIVRRRRLQPWVGLPNILCQEAIVPEYLQERASPQNLALAVMDWFEKLGTKDSAMDRLDQQYRTLHESLQRDTPGLATGAIAEVINR